jgi:hypothetical protein
MNIQHKILPYKLDIKALIFFVSSFAIATFSLVLFFSGKADRDQMLGLVFDYGEIIAPVTILWVLLEKKLWHTPLLQKFNQLLNIPPDFRGRWEGSLFSSLAPDQPRQFTIEVEQTLTTLKITSYSDFGNSRSILAEIGSDETEELFSLCFLWQGEAENASEGGKLINRFNGYTILNWDKNGNHDALEGSYFTNLQPRQTLGSISLRRTGYKLKKSL